MFLRRKSKTVVPRGDEATEGGGQQPGKWQGGRGSKGKGVAAMPAHSRLTVGSPAAFARFNSGRICGSVIPAPRRPVEHDERDAGNCAQPKASSSFASSSDETFAASIVSGAITASSWFFPLLPWKPRADTVDELTLY